MTAQTEPREDIQQQAPVVEPTNVKEIPKETAVDLAEPSNIQVALDEALSKLEKVQKLQKENFIFYKQVYRCTDEAWQRTENARLMKDSITRFLEPAQKKLQEQEDGARQVSLLKEQLQKQQEHYEQIIRVKSDLNDKYKQEMNEAKEQAGSYKGEVLHVQKERNELRINLNKSEKEKESMKTQIQEAKKLQGELQEAKANMQRACAEAEELKKTMAQMKSRADAQIKELQNATCMELARPNKPHGRRNDTSSDAARAA